MTFWAAVVQALAAQATGERKKCSGKPAEDVGYGDASSARTASLYTSVCCGR